MYRRRTAVVMLYVSTGVILALIALLQVGIYSVFIRLEIFALMVSPLFFFAASIGLWFKPRLGYAGAVIGGALALIWFVPLELSTELQGAWVSFNYSGPPPSGLDPLRLQQLHVPAIALALVSILVSSCWLLRRPALHGLTITAPVLAMWFAYGAIPYRIPAYDHSSSAEFRILHIQKRGLQFHETGLDELRDGKMFTWDGDRQLFQYRFSGRMDKRQWTDSPFILDRARVFPTSAEVRDLRTPLPRILWAWNAEGWYVALKDARVLAFSTENGIRPPAEVIDLFEAIESLPPYDPRQFVDRDVCFGFCYDPLAALGFSVLPARERLLKSNASLSR